MIIDQASSATAYVNVVRAAAEGRMIPQGWAVDAEGKETQDSAKALEGALLPFGGRKGANVALMVGMLSAGLSEGPWSLDAPSFASGNSSPAVGLTILAINPRSKEVPSRARSQTERLREHGVFIPGVDELALKTCDTSISNPKEVLQAVESFATGN